MQNFINQKNTVANITKSNNKILNILAYNTIHINPKQH